MPQLSDLIEKKKFIKKEYRPWDLSGTGTVDNKERSNILQNNSVSEEKSPANETLSTNVDSSQITEISGNKLGNELGNNQVTNREQTGNELDNIWVTTDNELGNNQVTNSEQIGNELGNKLSNVTGNNRGLAYLIESIKKLSGIQKYIFFYVINLCSARASLDTGYILTSDLANMANCTVGSVKTSLTRLITKHLILRFQGKTSRGGHMVLGVTKEIQVATIQAQQPLLNPFKITQTGNVTGNILGNVLGNTCSSSSSYKNNTTTTTALPDEWKKINCDLLSPIGFSETQLQQLYERHATTPEVVQDAINRFAYSLEHSDKTKAYSDPLNVLMGVLRKGQRWIEPNYVSPKDLALRSLFEEKRKQKEERDAIVKQLIELEFPEWRRKLTDEEIKKIVPEDVRKTNLTAAIQATLRIYFTEKVLLPRLDLDVA